MSFIAVPDSVGEVLYGPMGHYLVGNKVFYSNRDALAAANISKEKVSWHFYDHIWQQAHAQGAWRYQTLDQLYRARARQIRQNYDYVAILFSGGWDSRNIIDSFAREGLHIDDLVIFINPELEKTADFHNKQAINWYGEIVYHAVPHALQFQQTHPKTHVTQIDWLDVVEQAYADPALAMKLGRAKPGLLFGRWLKVAQDPGLEKRIAGKKACMLIGMDKPCIIQDDSVARAFFPEGLVRMFSIVNKSSGFPSNITWEPFYWTPDLPDLAIRGWYEILDLCRTNPLVNRAHNFATSLNQRSILKMSRSVQDAIRERLYHSFDPSAWQAEKLTDFGFFMEIELPILKVLEQRNPRIRSVLREVLAENLKLVGEQHVKIGSTLNSGLAPWVDKPLHDGQTVLDWTSFLSEFIDLDMSFRC